MRAGVTAAILSDVDCLANGKKLGVKAVAMVAVRARVAATFILMVCNGVRGLVVVLEENEKW